MAPLLPVRKSIPAALLVLAPTCLATCGDGSDNPVDHTGPFAVRFALDATFQVPHGGDPIHWALVRAASGSIVAEGSGTVSATADPSFSFATGDVMERGVGHEIRYWIDSDIGGGTPGVCDPPAIDHQWSTELLSPTNDVDLTVAYNPGLIEDVCGTFDP